MEEKTEIDLLVNVSKSMTSDELNEYIANRFQNDLTVFKKLVHGHKDSIDSVRNKKDIAPLIAKVKILFDDMIADKLLKKDFKIIERNDLEWFKEGQARDEADCALEEFLKTNPLEYKTGFRLLNKIYTIDYEKLIDLYARPLVEKITGKLILEKGRILQAMNEYRAGAHVEVFKSLLPQIRNSIQHQDFIINPKVPEITFYDQKKRPLTFNAKDYYALVMETFLLTIAFDIVVFDLEFPFNELLIDELDTVVAYSNKNNVKIVKKGGGLLSLRDFALLIKTGKIST